MWVIYSIIAIVLSGVSDLFRKLASVGEDPFVVNLLFQGGAFTAGLLMFLVFSKKQAMPMGILGYAFVGGFLIATFTLFSFRALSGGPGVSTVMPILRIGGVVVVSLLGVLVLKEKMVWQSVVGMVLALMGIYILFTSSGK